jgi:hypothetical protein
MVVSLIEGRRVSRRAILQLVAKNLRQHAMSRCSKIDQAVLWLNEQPVGGRNFVAQRSC